MPYLLYHSPGTGSEIVLAALRACKAPHKIIELDYSRVATSTEKRLKKINPLSRVPTLVLPNKKVLTESGAMIMHLGSAYPRAGLVPKPSTPEHTLFLRQLFTLVGEIYPCFTFADDPSEWVRAVSSRKPYKNAVNRHHQALWKYFEALLDPRGPWACGKKPTGVDLYLAWMTQWRPGKDWFSENTPKLAKRAEKAREWCARLR